MHKNMTINISVNVLEINFLIKLCHTMHLKMTNLGIKLYYNYIRKNSSIFTQLGDIYEILMFSDLLKSHTKITQGVIKSWCTLPLHRKLDLCTRGFNRNTFGEWLFLTNVYFFKKRIVCYLSKYFDKCKVLTVHINTLWKNNYSRVQDHL